MKVTFNMATSVVQFMLKFFEIMLVLDMKKIRGHPRGHPKNSSIILLYVCKQQINVRDVG